MYLCPYCMHYSIKEKISSFNLWITLIFTLHLSFSLCFFHLHTSKLFLAKYEAAKSGSWSVAIIMIIPLWCHLYEVNSYRCEHTANSFHFLRQQWFCSRITHMLPLLPYSGCYLSPIYSFLPFCPYDSAVEYFTIPRNFNAPLTLKIVPECQGYFPSLWRGEEMIKH